MMKRRLLILNAQTHHWQLKTLRVEVFEHDSREDYFVLSGEALCQYLLRRDRDSLIIARGPTPFISGNKASVGYVSPLTGLPHYSFVGGRAAAMLFNLGLDAIWFRGRRRQDDESENPTYVVISGHAPDLQVDLKPAMELPSGQRSAFYWLVEHELDHVQHNGSVFTLGEGAQLGYGSANLAVEAIYHAGRGGAGEVFARFASALVLRAETASLSEFFIETSTPFARNPNALIAPLVATHCARLSDRTGGTITKLFTTGADPSGKNTLPAKNAQQLGHDMALLGSAPILSATRHGKTGCHWCQVDCRHWHWIPADYAPDGKDIFLDDFEPAFSIFAMLGLMPQDNSVQAILDLVSRVEQRLILPIEQMGCDIVNVGIGLAALFEGANRGLIPSGDVPDFVVQSGLGDLDAAAQVIELLRSGETELYPALRAVGDGPQALANLYPAIQDIVFTGGKGTLGNAGHCNALWTFLMPFSRFFSHYAGQIYKIDQTLPPPGQKPEVYMSCFDQVVEQMLAREFFGVLCNALSQCAFTFVVFSQNGRGECLSDDNLLVRLLHNYGIHTTRSDLEWFSQAFWAQSIDLKCQFGWHPPSASDLPYRVYEALSLALERSPEEMQWLMQLLIDVWKRRAGEVMMRFGYELMWKCS